MKPAGRELIVDPHRMYILTEDDNGDLYLDVACGGFALSRAVLRLSEEEVASYRSLGKPFVDELSLKVAKKSSGLIGRIER